MRLSILKLEKSYHLLCKARQITAYMIPITAASCTAACANPCAFFRLPRPMHCRDLNLSSHRAIGRQPLGNAR